MNSLHRLLLTLVAGGPLAAQCGLVADITPGTTSASNITGLAAAFGNELYFQGNSAATGIELWKWDAQNGAQLVVDQSPGTYHSRPEHITPCCTASGPRVFYSAFEIGHGHELYASDGTAAGTGRVREIRAGSSSSLPFDFCASAGRVYFVANNGTHGQELWVSDGTSAGTERLSDFAPGTQSGRPNDMIDLDGLVIFSAFDPTTGREVFVSDGTFAGTQLLLDIEPGAAASDPREFTRVGDAIYFTADTSANGREVWKTDGTTAGTTMVADLFGPSSVGPVELCACGDRLFFREWVGSSYGDMHVTDGTAGGTVNLGVWGTRLVCSGDRVFFAGSDPVTGQELWVTNGTVAGTQLVLDLDPAGSSNPTQFVDCGPGVCFVAHTATSGEVWFSDGSAAGTTMLCQLDPGGLANPDELTMVRGRVFFEAYSPTYGRELFGIQTPGASRDLLGSGGAPDYPTLTTAGGGVPVLGTTVDIEGAGPAGHTGVLLAGPAGLPVATPAIPGLIDGGCDWVGLQAGAAVTVTTVFSPGFTVPFAIPANAAFEGTIFQFQTVWFHPTATPTLQVSNGLQLTIGAAAAH